MATVVYSARALDHLQHSFEFLAQNQPAAVLRAASAIRSAVDMLVAHPLLGRPRKGELHELVVSFGKTGYVVLYRFLPHIEEVRVLAIRHQRELNYPL